MRKSCSGDASEEALAGRKKDSEKKGTAMMRAWLFMLPICSTLSALLLWGVLGVGERKRNGLQVFDFSWKTVLPDSSPAC